MDRGDMFSTKRKSALGGRIYPLWVSATYGRLAESQPENPGVRCSKL